MNVFEDLCSTVFHRNWPETSAEDFNRMPLMEQVSILNSLVFDVRSVCLRSGTDTHAVSMHVADRVAAFLFDEIIEAEKPVDLPAPAPVPDPDRHKLPFLTRAKIAFHFLWHG